mmetsp:Transcript_12745/g.29930  ORF Transcript_12745/g.29930 Transcript_12745/m.29930 type:complete len:438 (-) Transcript_12745:122-1435(-)
MAVSLPSIVTFDEPQQPEVQHMGPVSPARGRYRMHGQPQPLERALSMLAKKIAAMHNLPEEEKKKVSLGDCTRYVDAPELDEWLQDKLDCALDPDQLAALVSEFGDRKHKSHGVRLDALLMELFTLGSAENIQQQEAAAAKEKESKSRRLRGKLKMSVAISKGSENTRAAKASMRSAKADTIRKNALSKIDEAAKRLSVRRNANEDPLAAFKGEVMPPETFATHLRTSLQVSLTPDEAISCLEVFDHDGDGAIDAAEFVSIFFKMIDGHRSKKIENTRQARQRREEELNKRDFKINHEDSSSRPPIHQVAWSQKHLRKASAKLAAAAAEFGKQRTISKETCNMQLFSDSTIPGREFIGLLHSMLGVKLRDAEAAAFIACLSYEGVGPMPSGKMNRFTGLAVNPGPEVVDGEKFLLCWGQLKREHGKHFTNAGDGQWR